MRRGRFADFYTYSVRVLQCDGDSTLHGDTLGDSEGIKLPLQRRLRVLAKMKKAVAIVSLAAAWLPARGLPKMTLSLPSQCSTVGHGRVFSLNEKAVYRRGVFEGGTLMRTATTPRVSPEIDVNKIYHGTFITEFKVSELVEGLDKFYEDPVPDPSELP